MRKSLVFLLMILSPALLIAQVKPASQSKSLVFNHVTVIDMTGALPKSDMMVVVIGNHIAALGHSGEVRVPRDAQVIDAAGKFLIPGLWDMHVHSLYEGRPEFLFPMFIANGVTGVRELGSTMPLEQINIIRRQIELGTILAPRFGAVAGKILESSVEQLGPEFEAVASPDEARRLVRERKEKGADFVKVYNQLPRDIYFAIADEAKKQGIPFVGHLPHSINAGEASDAGQKSMEHLPRILLSVSSREAAIREDLLAAAGKNLNAGRLAGWRADSEAADSYDAEKAADLFVRFRRNQTWQCPTLVQLRKFAVSDDENFRNDARLKYIPLTVRQRWRTLLATNLAEILPFGKKIFPKQMDLVKAMNASRVMFLAGTDSGWGNPYTFAGFSLHDELALLVQAGLSPMQALQTATLNPAKFLKMEKTHGTIERGKIADLILLDANPLESIGNTQKIAAVVVNGRYLPKESLQRMLKDVEAMAK